MIRRTDPHAAAIEAEAERIDDDAQRGSGFARTDIAEELVHMCDEIVASVFTKDGGLEMSTAKDLVQEAITRLAKRRVEAGV